jgi:Zn-dependent peptidase ImmA (M78 family)
MGGQATPFPPQCTLTAVSESEAEKELRRERATAAAIEARAQTGVPLDMPLECIVSTVEESFDLVVVIAQLGKGLAGAYAKLPRWNVALIAGKDAAVRRRFTLAHELGHHYLGHGPGFDTNSSLSDEVDPDESSANRFAAEFIAPRQAVERFVSELDDDSATLELVCRLANHFAMSPKAARIRLETTEVLTDHSLLVRLDREIDDHQAKGCFERLGLTDRDDLCRLPADRLPRLPAEARGSALADYLAGKIDADQLADAIDRSSEQVEDALGSSVA